MFKWLWDRYFFTGMLVLWAISLFTLVTLKVFGYVGTIPNIPTSTATAYGTMFSIPVILEIIKWRYKVSKEKKDASSSNSNKDT